MNAAWPARRPDGGLAAFRYKTAQSLPALPCCLLNSAITRNGRKPLRLDEFKETLARFRANIPFAIKTGAACAHNTKATASNCTGIAPVLMDWSRLEQFREFGDDALTMTREIVSPFIFDAPARLAALQTALASNNSAALSQTAHALKASASDIGASAIGDACGQLEQPCLQGV